MRHPFPVKGRALGASIHLVALILLNGCARSPDARPDTEPAPPAPAATSRAIAPENAPAALATAPPAVAAPPVAAAAAARPPAQVVEPVAKPAAAVKPAAANPTPKPAPPPLLATPATPATAKPQPTPAPQAAPQPTASKPAPLDLTSLEQRIRDTKAIGALTKLTLKNQVDDLLDQFRQYYQGKLKTDLAALRRSYDLLVLKFVSLLQDDDPPLATAIVASREDIWGLLSDRTKFATL